MALFFNGNLGTLPSNFDATSVTTMSYLFSSCSSLIKVDLSNLNITNVAIMKEMFYSCNSLIEEILGM